MNVGAKISCRIAPRYPFPVPAAVVRLLRWDTLAEAICCFRGCEHRMEFRTKSPYLSQALARQEIIRHIFAAHPPGPHDRAVVDTLKPDGHGGWTDLERAVTAELLAHAQRFGMIRKGESDG